jgi:putative heme-binding domain-containing protein
MMMKLFLFAVISLAPLAQAQKLPDGFILKEWAGEDLVANPVAIEVDEKGRVFVAESFRQGKGVDDNRNRYFWLLDDLAAQSVADRLAYIKKWAGKVPLNHYTDNEDRITRLEDTNGDGKADKKTIFSDRYNDYLDGTGAGLLAIDGTVYYTCIPHVWMLPDADAGVKAALDAYQGGLDKTDLLAPYVLALEGGDAERGKALFESHVAAQCMRCHKVGESPAPGGEAGPNLWGIGPRQSRANILESLINPSARIAEGFELTTVTLKDGTVVAGTVLSDSAVDLVIGEFTGSKKHILKHEIKNRAAVQVSAMPPVGGLLQPRELRDLVEFLASLK